MVRSKRGLVGTRLAAVSLMAAMLGCSSTPEREFLRQVVRIGIVPFDRVLAARDQPEPGTRESTLRALFLESGCHAFAPIQADALRTPKVVCRIVGDSPETILVTAEYGRSRERRRDGWEAASLLPLIAESIARVPRANSVLFAAFEDAPEGFRTRGAVARTLAMFPVGERPKVKAWISLTSSEIVERAAWRAGSSHQLLADFLAVARNTGVPVGLIDRTGQARDPSSPVPTLSAVLGHAYVDDYLASYRTFAAYIAFADYSIDAREAPATDAPHDPVPL